MNSSIFQGCVHALMTPCLADRAPNYSSLVKKAQALMTAGMNGVAYCGSTIVDQALIVKGWGNGVPALEIDAEPAKSGDQFRFGHETCDDGTNLVVWLNLQSEELVNIIQRPRDP